MTTFSSHIAAQDKGKRLMVQPPAPLALHVLNQDLDILFFTNQKPFRNNHKIIPRGTDFTAWHGRLAPSKNAAWGALGIQDLLRLSHFSPSMLSWMIGMSLLDVAAITGLLISPTDFTFDMQPKHQYNIAPKTSYSGFIAHHMGVEGTPITDDEHVAFLFYWLNAIDFYSRSVQMQKLFLPLVTLLHEGNNLNLAKLLLGHLFEELGQFVNCLRNNYLISTGGPLWLLELWLNAIFEKYMIKPGGGVLDKQHIEDF
ncbi:hypothetical protein Ahy_A09g044320 [Arachis hypogaea]|uniref:Aminotransferase-like plant mobile domain-containing protein n=1 Tax=Arachis hypogaea TaxID=3818 RepID=A0A445BJV7_ARAHY|nr:hypothetical protein Ahy_A09g044320 [Arachis hypogaea]